MLAHVIALDPTVKQAKALAQAAGCARFAYNGGGATNIKSHRNVANNIGTAYAVGGIIELSWDGTQWQDMSQ